MDGNGTEPEPEDDDETDDERGSRHEVVDRLRLRRIAGIRQNMAILSIDLDVFESCIMCPIPTTVA